jgi:2-C-methyl-D-erythritol 4-phosphate cytidylyltransferase/2-C-methyl-D-erythritol 2,4-cyclodiphosphate synthase
MLNAAIIVAAGRGVRASSAGGGPKQYWRIAGQPVLLHSLRAFLNHDTIDLVQPVIHADDGTLYQAALAGISSPKLLPPVHGGANRQASVLAGLRALASHAPDTVLIHDAARPFVTAEIIARVLAGLGDTPGCLAALPVSDTLKAEANGRVSRTVPRDGLWRAQTPQGFHFGVILAAHERAAADGRSDFTDDAAIAEWQDVPVSLVLGSERNAKLTTPEDFELAQRIHAGAGGAVLMMETRTGTGFDVHAFAAGGDHVMLCGVAVPHDASLSGHSDADVGLHALTDALLGAICDGDIGQHFPPTDPQWRGADSSVFLRHAAGLVRQAGGRVVHADVTLICESPKVGPHRERMRARIAEILDVDAGRVSVKATTTEQLGFTGRREGIAAMAAATVELTRKDEQDA